MSFDLHTHSEFSDGTDSPAQLMKSAEAAGLAGIAVVDHDTTDGWPAFAAARPAALTLIRGTELSTHVRAAGRRVSVHLLAYLFDPAAPALVRELQRLRRDRLERGMAIVERMVAAGVPISRQQVLDIAGDAPVGRPHIGRALMEQSLVDTVSEAFATYLSPAGPYYVHKSDMALLDAIDLVRHAGGVPVVAHPRSRGAARITDERRLREWVDHGLAGIEVDHPDHGPADREQLRDIASRIGILVTGASDYHGTNKPIRIGQESSDGDVVAALAAESSGRTPVLGPAR